MTQPGHDLIRAERFRQVASEGYSAEHDEGHAPELLAAAECYAHNARAVIDGRARHPELPPTNVQGFTTPPPGWPWDAEYWKPTHDPRRDAVKAGALIAAAIDATPAQVTHQFTVVGVWREAYPEGVGPVATFVYDGVVTPVHGPDEAAGWFEVVEASDGAAAVQAALAKAAERRATEESAGVPS